VRAIVKVGGDLTRQQAYDGWKPYLVQRWLTPIVGLDTLAKNIAGLCVTAPKLSYVDFNEKRGKLGWQDTMAVEKERDMHHKNVREPGAKHLRDGRLLSWDDWSGGFEAVFPQVLGILVVTWSAVWLFHLAFGKEYVPGFEGEMWRAVRGDNLTLRVAM
jgi:hypothetical protein